MAKSRKGLRKLVDVWGSIEGSPLHAVLRNFLDYHRIGYKAEQWADHDGEEFWRYRVQAADLQWAQSVLPALQDLHRFCIRRARMKVSADVPADRVPGA